MQASIIDIGKSFPLLRYHRTFNPLLSSSQKFLHQGCSICVTIIIASRSTIQPSFRGDVEQLDKLLAKMIVPRSSVEVSIKKVLRLVVQENFKSFHVCTRTFSVHCDFKSPVPNHVPRTVTIYPLIPHYTLCELGIHNRHAPK